MIAMKAGIATIPPIATPRPVIANPAPSAAGVIRPSATARPLAPLIAFPNHSEASRATRTFFHASIRLAAAPTTVPSA